MELLDRYLSTVGFWLPKPQRNDILAELSEDIRSQIDEREAELGRKLNEGELEAILSRWGNPLLVAGRYLPQHYLIGPILYPLYVLVLKIVALVYVVPWLLVWMGLMLFSPVYREGKSNVEQIGALSTLLSIVAYLFFFITLGFAYFDRYKMQSWLKQDWMSTKLPVATNPKEISRTSSAVGLAVNLVLALWWLDLSRIREIWNPNWEEIALAPIWEWLYWPIFLLFVAGMVLNIFSLIRPYRTRIHIGLDLAREIYCLILIGLLMSAGPALIVVSVGNAPPDLAYIQEWITISSIATLAIVGTICLVQIVQDARRIIRGE